MKISVIIPAYKAELHLPRCLDSLLTQTLNDIEIIVVNDASPDSTGKLADNYAMHDTRVRVLHHEINRGPMVARHEGSKIAQGDYVTFVDADDFLPPNALELLYETALREGADLVCGNMDRVYDMDSFPSFILTNTLRFGSHAEGVYQALLTEELFHCMWGKLFRKEIFAADYTLVENMTYAEDELMLYQLTAHVHKAVTIDAIVYHYYFNPTSCTNTDLSLRQIENTILTTQWIDKIGETYPRLRKTAAGVCAHNIHKAIRDARNYPSSEVMSIIAKYGMQKYLSLFYVLTHAPFFQVLRVCKRDLESIKCRIFRAFTNAT